MNELRSMAPKNFFVLASSLAGLLGIVFCVYKASAETTEFISEHPTSLKITLWTDKARYRLGDQVLVAIRQQNISTQSVRYVVTGAPLDYDLFMVHGSNMMRPIPVIQRSFRGVPGGHEPPRLKPNASITEPGSKGSWSPIAAWGLNITEPGTYFITAVNNATRRKSNTVKISVSQ